MPTKEKLAKETPEQREKRLEYGKNYNKINSKKINKRNSEYRKNSQYFKNYRLIKLPCECGGSMNNSNKYIHRKCAKHLNWLENQSQTIIV